LEALQKISKKDRVFYAQGTTIDSLTDIENCIKLAHQVDKIIICLGEQPCTEIPGNIDDLSLPHAQQSLVERLAVTGKPVILVCAFNRPRIIHSLTGKVAAILYAYLPGDEGGRAIADCITGQKQPGGRLPFTYPSAVNALLKYDHKLAEEIDVDFSSNGFKPEFEFGSGSSYTSFSYSPIILSSDTLHADETLELKFTVRNIGKRAGEEVVQVYYRDEVASITPAAKKLVAYCKVKLNKEEEKEVTFILHRSDFSFVSKELKKITEPGRFQLMVAGQKTHFHVH
jgi:beta-glucosidase